MLDSLLKLSISDAVALALNDSEGAFAVVVTEYDEIRPITGRAIRDCNLDANACWLITVFVDQFSPELCPNLFFGGVINLRAVDGYVGNALFTASGE